jgi:tRNA (uracil-5-)-methyltransferase TRM9
MLTGFLACGLIFFIIYPDEINVDQQTIERLNNINQRFYAITADDFDQTRGCPWPGWERLLAYLDGVRSVLDVGCGNGRFGLFLADHLNRPLHYHGIDSSAALLDHAREALAARFELDTRLENRDVVLNPPDAGAYDLVVLFGMIHHIPGAEQRLTFMRALAERVAPDGLLIFASWRFYEDDRLRARIIPWPDDLAGQVEAGDYLLDWRRGEHALRYCHYVDDAEQDALVAATGLTEVTRYRADGASGLLNAYSVLRRGSE